MEGAVEPHRVLERVRRRVVRRVVVECCGDDRVYEGLFLVLIEQADVSFVYLVVDALSKPLFEPETIQCGDGGAEL